MLYYIRDIANNIIGLVDSNNQLVAKYSYDAFGNVLTKEGTYATKNPFLYKGYYYEHSMGLYYLESRYYDPRIRRFISPDNIDYLEPTSFSGLNLYAYCGNDPVNYYDPSGTVLISSTIIILSLIGIGALAGFGTVLYADYKDNGRIFDGSIGWETYLFGTILGGAIGGMIGYYAAPFISGLLASTGTIGGSLAFAGGAGSLGGGIAISTLGELAFAGTAVLTGIGGAVGGSLMLSKPNSGRIRYSDGTGIDPLTGKEATRK